jgi:excisionase family DNA binding protein
VIDVLFAQLRGVAEGWSREAARRRQISAVDPVADALSHCASELGEQLRQLDTDTAYLSVEDYARTQRVTPQTVRNWIRHGDLEAIRTERGVYRIRRDQRRRKSA